MSHTQALDVTVWRDGKEYKQHYSRGKPITTLTSITLSGETSSRQGTRIRFWPDKDSKQILTKKFSSVSTTSDANNFLMQYLPPRSVLTLIQSLVASESLPF